MAEDLDKDKAKEAGGGQPKPPEALTPDQQERRDEAAEAIQAAATGGPEAGLQDLGTPSATPTGPETDKPTLDRPMSPLSQSILEKLEGDEATGKPSEQPTSTTANADITGGSEPPKTIGIAAAGSEDGGSDETPVEPGQGEAKRYSVTDSSEEIYRDLVRRFQSGEITDAFAEISSLPIEKQAYVISEAFGDESMTPGDQQSLIEHFDEQVAKLPDGPEKARYRAEITEWKDELNKPPSAPEPALVPPGSELTPGGPEPAPEGPIPAEPGPEPATTPAPDIEEPPETPPQFSDTERQHYEWILSQPNKDALILGLDQAGKIKFETYQKQKEGEQLSSTLESEARTPVMRPEDLTDEERYLARLMEMNPRSLARELKRKEKMRDRHEKLAEAIMNDERSSQHAEAAAALDAEIELVKGILEERGVDIEDIEGRGASTTKQEKAQDTARKLDETMDEYRRFGESSFDELSKAENREQGVLKGLRESQARAKTQEEKDAIKSRIAEAEARIAVIKSFKAEKETEHFEDQNAEAILEAEKRRRELGDIPAIQKGIDGNRTQIETLDKDILALEEKINKAVEGSADWRRLNGQKLELSKQANKLREKLRLDEEALKVAKEKARKEKGTSTVPTLENIDQKTDDEFGMMSRADQIKYLETVGRVLPKLSEGEFTKLNNAAMAGEPLSIEQRAHLQREISKRLLNGTYDAKCLTKLGAQYGEVSDMVVEKFMRSKELEKWRRENCPTGWEKLIDLAKKYPAILAILAMLIAGGVSYAGGAIPALGLAGVGARRGIF